jgi:hypothetical protein
MLKNFVTGVFFWFGINLFLFITLITGVESDAQLGH